MLLFLGCIRMFVWWRIRATINREGEGVGSLGIGLSPTLFWKMEKICRAFFNVSLMKCLSKHPYSKKPYLPCENPDRTSVYSFHSWQTNWLSCHVNIVSDRFLLHFKNLSDIMWSVYLERNKSKWEKKNVKSMEKKFFAMKQNSQSVLCNQYFLINVY